MLALPLLLALHGAVAQPPASTGDSTRPTTHRVAVTPALERSAFADEGARTLLSRARVARLAQDSALRAYDAKTHQRMTVGLGITRFGPERILLRHEDAALVHWDRTHGVAIQPTARRTVMPMLKGARADIDGLDLAPIPYYPGRDALWSPLGLGVVKREVDDRELVHPLAVGAEAYYRYATGDSMSVKLPDGRAIALRELRITARRADWRVFVGSFWFDVDGGQLVRAAYRMSEDIDIWRMGSEEERRELAAAIERVRTDTTAAGRRLAEQHLKAERADMRGVRMGKLLASPMRATISAITVEYGLHEGRFWLPRHNVAEGEAQVSFMRIPVKIEETYRYDRVNGDVVPAFAAAVPIAPVPALADARTVRDSALAAAALARTDTALMGIGGVNIGGPRGRAVQTDADRVQREARIDSVLRRRLAWADSLGREADSLRAAGDTAEARRTRLSQGNVLADAARIVRREQQCTTDSTYDAGPQTMTEDGVRLTIRRRRPCQPARLATSPDLPASPFDANEAVFDDAAREQLLGVLGMSLQPGWGPQPVRLHSGLDLARYNRIEGLSLGASATSTLGAGYTAQATLRLGTADLVPNGELWLARDDGRRTLHVAAFHRLGVANDDWGSPLSFGASLASLLYARDEGFYYRTFGAEVGGRRAAPLFGATVDWRIFGERQRSAGATPRTQISLGNLIGSARFIDNVAADRASLAGADVRLARTFGADPAGFRLATRLSGEGAVVAGIDSLRRVGRAPLIDGTTGYGRLMAEGTLSHGFGRFAAAVTGGAGAIAGDAPTQRLFYVGGLQTVRGQFARPTGASYVGDAFWLTRAELARDALAARLALFFDAGWAGARADRQHPGRPLTGTGIGLSLLDGLVRTDLSRGLGPERRTRFDVYLQARF